MSRDSHKAAELESAGLEIGISVRIRRDTLDLKLGAGDGGETFLDKFGGSNGFPVTQRKGDFAEARTARE